MLNFKEQAFGLELEFSGITRQAACAAISEVVARGKAPRYNGGVYYAWTVDDAQGRIWTVERDSSVNYINGGEQCEFVTPKCVYDDIPTVQECIRALRRAGAKVDSSCGIHIHVDGANHTAQSLKNLIFTFRAKEDLIFKAVGTRRSRLGRWCKPIDDYLIHEVKKIKKLDEYALKDTWYSTYGYGDPTDCHYNSSRYHALNLHSMWYRGTVEFRLFESTLHAGEVRAYINLCLAMSAQAINSKRASADVLENGNDKYAMRCWLLRLGFIGDEYKTVREHLMKRLTGNTAWRNDPNTYESYRNRRGITDGTESQTTEDQSA